MKKTTALYLLLLAIIGLTIFIQSSLFAQKLPFKNLTVSVDPSLQQKFTKGGRLFIRFTQQKEKEPRFQNEISVSLTPENWEANQPMIINRKTINFKSKGLDKWVSNERDQFYFQILYKQNVDDGGDNVEGNIYSTLDSVILSPKVSLKVSLTHLIPATKIIDHKFVKSFVIKSDILSAFSGHDRYIKAAVLLPATYYDNPQANFPICYRAPGLNGRYDKINGHMKEKGFTDFWFSKEAPQIIYVYLDSQGPYGDTYQVDSDNNGPCGKALTEELIPLIEKEVGYNPASKLRFLTGYSTGGWVALGLQIFYPDFFDGTWSYSPDPIDFEHYGLINIYKDSSIFYNSYGYLQPGRRTIYGEPTYSMKDWIANENSNSRTNNYLVSGGQFGAYNAVFGPRAIDGLPSLMFDANTGVIDHSIAKQWEKYDLKKVLEKNWSVLGPKLQGKIWIWTGDMDGLYSNVATRFFKMYLDKTAQPKSDAKISFTPMAGHTAEWNDIAVLKMINEKAIQLKK